MKTIKEMRNGVAYYRKPSPRKHEEEEKYVPSRSNKNKWYFNDRKKSISLQVWDIGQEYINRMQDIKLRPRHRIKNPVSLVKLLYWYYLTGARQQEAFLKPYPTLSIINREGETRAIVTHVNQKHRKGGKKDSVSAVIPIFDDVEGRMWDFITDGGQNFDAASIFDYGLWASHSKHNISCLFSKNFKTNLVDPATGEVHKQAGIIPHILRHMRSYNVLIERGMYKQGREIIKLWFGWDSDFMLDYYAHTRAVLTIANQEDMLKKSGLLTNIKVDASRSFMTKPS